MQDTREISPWDILEGVKYGGPLMLSWFGAVRMKRKPLKYEEQRKLVSLHSHQNRFKEMMHKPYYVSLPDPTPQTNPFADTPESVSDSQPPGKAEAALASDQESSNKLVTVASAAQMAPGATTTNSTHVGMRPQVPSNQMQHPVSMQGPFARHPMQQPNPAQISRPFVHVHGGTQGMIQIESQSNMPPHHSGMEAQPQTFQADMRQKLRGIQAMQRERYTQSAAQPPPMYPGHTVGQMPRPPGGYAMPQRMMQQEVLARMNPTQRAYYIQQQRQRIRQQQQQRVMAMAVRRPTMMGQFNPQYQPMRPLQAAPAVPMQQVGDHSMVLFRYQNVPFFVLASR